MYVPMDLLCDADFKMRMSEKAEEIASLVDIEMALNFAS